MKYVVKVVSETFVEFELPDDQLLDTGDSMEDQLTVEEQQMILDAVEEAGLPYQPVLTSMRPSRDGNQEGYEGGRWVKLDEDFRRI